MGNQLLKKAFLCTGLVLLTGTVHYPFNTSTSIWVRLPENTQVSLDIINMQGKLVERLPKGKLKSGAHQFFWNAENRSSGIYFIKLITGSTVYGRRISLLR